MRRTAALFLAACLLGGPVAAQDRDQTLADIRQTLSVLYIDIQRLRTELSTTGNLSSVDGGSSPLERLNAIEAELQRLTSKTEELEFRINRITTDGTNRIGDLEFRLCELEDGCDIGQLGDTPSLGGVDSAAAVPQPAPPPPAGGPALALGEQADFDRAKGSFEAGNAAEGAQLLATFIESYPGSPLAAEAHYLRGQALEQQANMTDAARAYLSAFSANPQGPQAPDALFKLGASLGALGQTQDACITLTEVGIRFPGSAAEAEARQSMLALGCS